MTTRELNRIVAHLENVIDTELADYEIDERGQIAELLGDHLRGLENAADDWRGRQGGEPSESLSADQRNPNIRAVMAMAR